MPAVAMLRYKDSILKDEQYNEQYKKRNEKTVVHRTMHIQQKM